VASASKWVTAIVIARMVDQVSLFYRWLVLKFSRTSSSFPILLKNILAGGQITLMMPGNIYDFFNKVLTVSKKQYNFTALAWLCLGL
jgi:hypothetical protein